MTAPLLAEPDGGQHLVGLAREGCVAGDGTAHIETARAEGGQRHHDVLARRELVEQRHDLEGARHALVGDGVGAEAGDILAIETDAAAARLDPTGQHIEERGLAGAVGAHDAVQLAFRHGQVDLLEHHAVPEAHVHAFRLDQSHQLLLKSKRSAAPPCARNAWRSSTDLTMPAMPSGRNSTSAMNSRPK